jgi:hypothetical protein
MNRNIKVALAGGEEAWGSPPQWILEMLLGDSKGLLDLQLAGSEAEFVVVNQNPASLRQLAGEFFEIPVRIFIATEAICPDFNLFDYAVGFDALTFPGRYEQFHPLHFFQRYLKYGSLEKKENEVREALKKKRRFCDFIYSNANANPARDEFFDLLSSKEFVHSAGAYRSNIESSILRTSWDSDWRQAKIEYQSESFFSFAFENASHLGYTTEKIITSMLAKSVPIYWGNAAIGEYFNSKAFVNCHQFDSLTKACDKILMIYSDPSAYREMLTQPWMTAENCAKFVSRKQAVEGFLLDTLSRPAKETRVRGKGTWNDSYERCWRNSHFFNSTASQGLSLQKRYTNYLRKFASKLLHRFWL